MPCPVVAGEQLFGGLAIKEPWVAALDIEWIVGIIEQEHFDTVGEFRRRRPAPLHDRGDAVRSDGETGNLLGVRGRGGGQAECNCEENEQDNSYGTHGGNLLLGGMRRWPLRFGVQPC